MFLSTVQEIERFFSDKNSKEKTRHKVTLADIK